MICIRTSISVQFMRIMTHFMDIREMFDLCSVSSCTCMIYEFIIKKTALKKKKKNARMDLCHFFMNICMTTKRHTQNLIFVITCLLSGKFLGKLIKEALIGIQLKINHTKIMSSS